MISILLLHMITQPYRATLFLNNFLILIVWYQFFFQFFFDVFFSVTCEMIELGYYYDDDYWFEYGENAGWWWYDVYSAGGWCWFYWYWYWLLFLMLIWRLLNFFFVLLFDSDMFLFVIFVQRFFDWEFISIFFQE